MKTISIRELHLKTGRWVRHAASRGPIVVTDRGRRVAALHPFDASVTGRPLPNREAVIRKRSRVSVDSAVYQSELREDRWSTSTQRTSKCYLNEPGADRVREVAYGADGLASCELARLEFASILKRHVREHHVTRRKMTAILKEFERGREERRVTVVWCDVGASGEDPHSRPRPFEHGLRPIW
jgi:antitoxin (DNA-binding transcriptional repressor) of toxin-antitoxin stability system